MDITGHATQRVLQLLGLSYQREFIKNSTAVEIMCG